MRVTGSYLLIQQHIEQTRYALDASVVALPVIVARLFLDQQYRPRLPILVGEGPHVRGCWVVDLVLGKE